MKVVLLTCPSCGAHMSVAQGQMNTRCQFCGAQIYLDDEVQRIEQHIKYDNAEDAGYAFEKGRQRAQIEADQRFQQSAYGQPTQYWQPTQYLPTAQYGNQFASQQQVYQSTKRHTLLWVLGWIFFFPIPLGILLWRNRNTEAGKTAIWVLGWLFVFPIPLTVLMLRKKNMPPMQRNGIIATAWIAYLLLGVISGMMNPQTEPDDITDHTPQATTTTTETKQEPEHATENEQAPVEQPPVEQPTEQPPVEQPVEQQLVEQPIEQPPVMENAIPQDEQPPVAEDASLSAEQAPSTESEPIDNSQVAMPSEEQAVSQQPVITQTPVVNPEPTEQPNTNSVVYITPNGHSYHRSRSCPSLSRSKEVLEVSLEDAIAQGKSDPCNNCAL